MTGLQALRAIMRKPIVIRSLLVAVIVGTALNAINQGDVWLSGEPVNWAKLVLTYCVPFAVASFGAWSALIDKT